jgi:hypothetical protein
VRHETGRQDPPIAVECYESAGAQDHFEALFALGTGGGKMGDR